MRDRARITHSASFRRLQGKTQVFPGHESDFFRNRLTHSLEVANIAEEIALRLNMVVPSFQGRPIDERLCAAAGLAHDLGHPPFGHNGERALDDAMREFGGFEGNAQTLRILSVLEKKTRAEADESSARLGLNLTYRTLASILKYDEEIPHVRDERASLVKGYYATERKIVERIKDAVAPGWRDRSEPFKTIECTIMDVADDIAYSTYDLEDSFKAGFLTPLDMLASDDELIRRVARKVSKALKRTVTETEVGDIFLTVFDHVLHGQPTSDADDDSEGVLAAFRRSRSLVEDGYMRGLFSRQLVSGLVRNVEVEVDELHPSLSRAFLNPEARLAVEVLKNYTYEATIYSARVKVAEFRGYEVVKGIFDALASTRGFVLMPEDVRHLYKTNEANATARMRVVCDFVAGMTDRYALEFYGRLHSESAQSIFKPI